MCSPYSFVIIIYVILSEQPPSYPNEKPPAYNDVYPPHVLTTTAPPSYDITTSSQNNNNSTVNVPPSPAVPGSTVPQSVVISQPGNARPLRVIPFNQVLIANIMLFIMHDLRQCTVKL